MSFLMKVQNSGNQYAVVNNGVADHPVRPGDSAEILMADGATMTVKQQGASLGAKALFRIIFFNWGSRYVSIGTEDVLCEPGTSVQLDFPDGETVAAVQADPPVPFVPDTPNIVTNFAAVGDNVSCQFPPASAAAVHPVGSIVLFTNVLSTNAAVVPLLENQEVEVLTDKPDGTITFALPGSAGVNWGVTTATASIGTQRPPPTDIVVDIISFSATDPTVAELTDVALAEVTEGDIMRFVQTGGAPIPGLDGGNSIVGAKIDTTHVTLSDLNFAAEDVTGVTATGTISGK